MLPDPTAKGQVLPDLHVISWWAATAVSRHPWGKVFSEYCAVISVLCHNANICSPVGGIERPWFIVGIL